MYGIRLFDFPVENSLLVSSTSFPHKDSHKETWGSPDGVTRNEINHVLTESRVL
jgi:hypothetical protein